jgi:CubicO group peptidase (beta-lactamase class C family)
MNTFSRREALRSISLGTAGWLLSPQIFKETGLNSYSQVFSYNMPQAAMDAAEALAAGGIGVFTFNAADGWLVVANNGEVRSNNVSGGCIKKIEELIAAGHTVKSVAFPPKGSNSYVIITDKDHYTSEVDGKLIQKLKELKAKGSKVKQIAFRPKRGNDRWIIVTENGFTAQNIPDECYQILKNLQESPKLNGKPTRKINSVSFTNTGGWVVNADDYFFSRNIPGGCLKKMNDLKGKYLQSDEVVFSKSGWSVISHQSVSEAPIDEIRAFEKAVKGGGLWNRMKLSKVPGVSVAVIIDNKLAWSCGYGYLKTGGIHAAHSDSLYQAGSLSQLVSTIGALRLVRLGKIGLEEDLMAEELGLDISMKPGFELEEGQEATLAMLLANRSGYGVKGLKGYTKGRTLPNLDNIIKGAGGANNGKVAIEFPPNTRYEPSAGGFIMLDKIIQKVTDQPADKWLDENVLGPLKMKDSSFDIKVNKAFLDDYNVAAGHNPNGGTLTGERYSYPETSAYGLHTNVKNMANIISMINQGGSFNGETFITTDLIETLLTPVNQLEKRTRGLGAMVTNFEEINETGSNFRYTSSGQCAGFRSLIFGYPVQGTGVVVMTNGNAKDGPRFCYDVAKAVIDTYDWE